LKLAKVRWQLIFKTTLADDRFTQCKKDAIKNRQPGQSSLSLEDFHASLHERIF
jgi:hypothetical protein